MGDGFQFLDIILFALVAGFLILRLRSVLGRRDGHQSRAPGPFSSTSGKEHEEEKKVVRLPERADRPSDPSSPMESDELGAKEFEGPMHAGIAQIRVADPRFDAADFLSGARIAFELILTAYASGDRDKLRSLLSTDVFANFEQSIQEREQHQQRLELKIVGLMSADIVEAYMAGRTAHVTVKFVSEQVSALYAEDDTVVDGDATAITEVSDFWTFARDTRSSDPNWVLVATGSLE